MRLGAVHQEELLSLVYPVTFFNVNLIYSSRNRRCHLPLGMEELLPCNQLVWISWILPRRVPVPLQV